MAQAERYAFIVENFDHHSSMNRRYQFFYYLDTREIEMVSHNEDLAFGSRARRAHENESSPRSLTLPPLSALQDLTRAMGGLDVAADPTAMFGEKKKKKKKKQLAEGELEALTAAVGDGEGAAAADDGAGGLSLGLDLDLKKKKKKKKKDRGDDDFGEVGGAGEGGEGEAGGSAEESAGKPGMRMPWDGSDRDYKYEELLDRIFGLLKQNNPELTGEKRRTVLKPPQVLREGTKKTVFVNFSDLCKAMHRTQEHVLNFLLAELGTSGSLDGQQRLIVKGRFLPKAFEGVLRRYVNEYVLCQACKSPDTLLDKDERTRLYVLRCQQCGANRSVAAIKQGFQAQIGKRKKKL